MRVSWSITAHYQIDPALDIDQIKSVGPVWGSWQTWRACSTDNVICHSQSKARELLDRAFQAVCNFHVPRAYYEFLKRPVGVRLYEGDYRQEVDDIEDVIALQLAAASSDIVLMPGWYLGSIESTEDPLAQHRKVNRHGLIRSALAASTQTQFVVIDHAGDLDKAYKELPNVTCDTMANALQLLI